jgi:hypothetical protein
MQLKKAARKASNRFLSTFSGYVLCSACNRYYFSGTETGQCNKRRCPGRNRRIEEG